MKLSIDLADGRMTIECDEALTRAQLARLADPIGRLAGRMAVVRDERARTPDEVNEAQ